MKLGASLVVGFAAIAGTVLADSDQFGLISIRSASRFHFLSVGAEGTQLQLGSGNALQATVTDSGKLRLSDGQFAVVNPDGTLGEGSESEGTAGFSVETGNLRFLGSSSFFAIPSGETSALGVRTRNGEGIFIVIRAQSPTDGNTVSDFVPTEIPTEGRIISATTQSSPASVITTASGSDAVSGTSSVSALLGAIPSGPIAAGNFNSDGAVPRRAAVSAGGSAETVQVSTVSASGSVASGPQLIPQSGVTSASNPPVFVPAIPALTGFTPATQLLPDSASIPANTMVAQVPYNDDEAAAASQASAANAAASQGQVTDATSIPGVVPLLNATQPSNSTERGSQSITLVRTITSCIASGQCTEVPATLVTVVPIDSTIDTISGGPTPVIPGSNATATSSFLLSGAAGVVTAPAIGAAILAAAALLL